MLVNQESFYRTIMQQRNSLEHEMLSPNQQEAKYCFYQLETEGVVHHI